MTFQIIVLTAAQLTYHGPLHNGPIIYYGKNRAVVIDVRHLDNKVSRILNQLLVPIIHPGSQMVQALLLSVQGSGDKQVSFVIHGEDFVCSFAFYYKTLHLQSLARLQL